MIKTNHPTFQPSNHILFQLGFGIIEIIVAVSILAIIAASTAITVIGSFSTNRLGDEQTKASLFAQEGIEAAKSIKNQGWEDPFLATDCSSGCGLDSSGGAWAYSGTNNTLESKYTRTLLVQQAQRDAGGNIVSSGGTDDPDTYKVTSTVNWDFTSARSNIVELITYLTNWVKTICGWSTAHVEASHDRAGGSDPNDMALEGDYVYMVNDAQGGGNNEFYIVDVSTLTSITSVGEEIGEDVNGVAVYGDYAYIATSGAPEIEVVDISNKSNPQLLGTPSYDMQGGQDANKIAADANYVYVVRQNRTGAETQDYEFQIFNRSDLSYVGGYDIGSNANDLFILGNYAYVVTSDDSAELWEFDISTPSSVQLVGTYNAQDGSNGVGIYASGNSVYLTTQNNGGSGSGEPDGEFYVLTTSHTGPSPFTYQDHLDVGASVWDVKVEGSSALLATELANEEFVTVDISTPTSISKQTGVDLGGNSFCLAYSAATCTAFACSAAGSTELQVLQPGGGSGGGDTQADSLLVDTTGANIGGGGDRNLRGITLENTGGSTITITSIDITWDVAQNVQQVRISGSNLWSGSESSPASLDITDHVMNSSDTDNINRFRFAGDMTGTTFDIDFNMGDGSTKSVTSLTPPDG